MTPTERLDAAATPDFLDRFLAGRTGALRAMRRASQLAGAAELASGGKLPGQ